MRRTALLPCLRARCVVRAALRCAPLLAPCWILRAHTDAVPNQPFLQPATTLATHTTPTTKQVAVEAHREARLGLAPAPAPPPPAPPPRPLPPLPGARGPTDVFGQAHPPSAVEQIACMRCGRKVAAGRFAPHLEKCLGGGRQSSRQRRAAAG